MRNRSLLPIASLMVLLWFLSAAARPSLIEAAPAAKSQPTPADEPYQIYLPLVSCVLPTWQPKTPPLSTPWTATVSPTHVLPEYPRPQLGALALAQSQRRVAVCECGRR